MDDVGIPQFQKALSMPLNFTRVTEPNSAEVNKANQGIDILLSDLKIDEIDEDKDSVDESCSSVSSNHFTKRQSEWKSRKNVSEKKCNKINKKKFFIHKAHSFKKTHDARSISPVKGILQNIQSTKTKIKFMKMNSVAFKAQESRVSEMYSNVSPQSVSSDEEGEDDESKEGRVPAHKIRSSKNISRTIISPIR